MLKPAPYFWLDTRKQKNNQYQIRIRQNTKPHVVIKVDNEMIPAKSLWAENKTGSGGHSKDRNQQARLDDMMIRIEQAAKVLLDQGIRPTLQLCLDRINKPVDSTSPTSNKLMDWLQWMATRHGRGYLQNVDHLKDRKQTNTLLVDVTDDWIQRYAKYLVNDRKLKQSTILKRIHCIKTTLRAAQQRKQPTSELLDSYSVLKPVINQADPGTSKQPLNFIELMKLDELTGLNKRQQTVLDEFLLLCFTSVRVSDLMQSDKWQINNESITLRQKKTKTLVSITLNRISRQLIKKYSDIDINGNYTLRLPVFTGQYFNRELKTIGKLIGKTISSHHGRHSYAMLLSDVGIPSHLISSELGHAAGSVTENYGRQSDKTFVRQVVSSAINRAFDCYKPKMTYVNWFYAVNPHLRTESKMDSQANSISLSKT